MIGPAPVGLQDAICSMQLGADRARLFYTLLGLGTGGVGPVCFRDCAIEEVGAPWNTGWGDTVVSRSRPLYPGAFWVPAPGKQRSCKSGESGAMEGSGGQDLLLSPVMML